MTRVRSTKRRAVDLMLDSGAFSAWLSGDPLPLREYVDFLGEVSKFVESYVTLDVIPGERGVMRRSQHEIEESAAASHKNYVEMRRAGLSPIPVFHQGERFYWLDRMVAEGASYIGLSPYARAHQRQIVSWLDDCFARLTDSEGRPVVRTHGFGATGFRLIVRYPWYTADSTSWARGAGYGMVMIPRPDVRGGYSLAEPPYYVFAGTGRPRRNDVALMSASAREWVMAFVARVGCTSMDRLRADPTLRKAVNVEYMRLLEACRPQRFTHRGTFGSVTKPSERRKYSSGAGGVVFATMPLYHDQNVMLTQRGVRRRLLSYFLLRRMDAAAVESYVLEGHLSAREID